MVSDIVNRVKKRFLAPVIEHNLDLLKIDYLIDLDSEGGDGGGIVVDYGPDRKLCDLKKYLTASGYSLKEKSTGISSKKAGLKKKK